MDDSRAEIVNLTQAAQQGTDALFQYGALGVCVLVGIVAAWFFFRWALKKIDESNARVDALHAIYGQKLEAQQKEHAAVMRELISEFKPVVENNTRAVMSFEQRLKQVEEALERRIPQQQPWDGHERRGK